MLKLLIGVFVILIIASFLGRRVFGIFLAFLGVAALTSSPPIGIVMILIGTPMLLISRG